MFHRYSLFQRFQLFQHRHLPANALLLCVLTAAFRMGHAQISPEEEALSRAQAEAAQMRTQEEIMREESASTHQFDVRHANRQASDELLKTARLQPDTFIGKTLRFSNGTTIGPVLDMRRRNQDNQLYLIVDATRYFNESTEYAVAVKDLNRLDEEYVIMPMVRGMHLRGLVYYPEDYTDH